jgi:hypothetical protein
MSKLLREVSSERRGVRAARRLTPGASRPILGGGGAAMTRATTTEECRDLATAKAAARRGRPALLRDNGRDRYILVTERRFRRMAARLAEMEEEERDAEEAARVLRRVHTGKEKTYSTEEVKRELAR